MDGTLTGPESAIIHAIKWIRGEKVLLDRDLAILYGVETRTLIQAVKRNLSRFPPDFMIQLRAEEASALRSQIVILEPGRGKHRKYLPFAFTEQGVAMLASVLRSPRAIRTNIEIMRAFVRLRRLLSTNIELARKLDALERRYDQQFKVVFRAIRELMAPAISPSPQIGFSVEEPEVNGGG
jgi:hypothetical protein